MTSAAAAAYTYVVLTHESRACAVKYRAKEQELLFFYI